MTTVTICIATYKRPASLGKLLDSLVTQSDAPPFEVVVVDNDDEQSAKPVVDAASGGLNVRYLVEPRRGLAKVRNRAVAASAATFLAFIDDDEWATPEWLASLVRVAEDATADAVIGPVRTVFGPDTPAYIQHCRLFAESTLPDAAIVPWYATRTSNALVRRQSLPDLEAPFAAEYDFSGGEDVDLFRRMIDAGADVRASSGALVFEHRPGRRANLWWVLRRSIRNGATIADIEWRHFSRGVKLNKALASMLRAPIQILRAATVWRRDRIAGLHHLIDAAEGLGQLAHVLGLTIEEYRKPA